VSGSARRGSYRAALAKRDLRLVLGALVVSQIGSWAYSTALAIYVWDRTHSPGWVAAAALSRLLPALLFSPYAGVLGDRFERIRLMILLDGVNTVWLTLLAVAVVVHGPVALAIAISVASALTDTPYRSAEAAALPSIAGEEHLAAANAMNGTIQNLTILAGPALGALLLLAGPASVVFGIDAATFVVSALLLRACRTRSGGAPAATERSGAFAQITVGFRAITKSPVVLLLTVFCALDSFYAGITKVLFVSISIHVGTGATGYGYLLTAFGAGGVLAAAVTNRLAAADRLAPVIVGGMSLLYLPLVVQVGVTAPAAAAALQVVSGIGMLIVDIVAVTALQRAVPQDQLGRVFGVFWAIIIGAISLGSLLVPFTLRWLGLSGSLVLFGAGVTGVSLLGYPILHRSDRESAARLAVLRPRVVLLEALDLFAAASQPVLERLAAAATEERVTAGTVLIREGEAAGALYVLLEGEVAVSARGESGHERPIRRLGPESYFGEIGLLEHIPRTATVAALVDCRVLRLDGDDFLSAMAESPASPSLVEGVRARLAVTHPHRPATLAPATTEPTAS
jgi:MFS family permease